MFFFDEKNLINDTYKNFHQIPLLKKTVPYIVKLSLPFTLIQLTVNNTLVNIRNNDKLHCFLQF